MSEDLARDLLHEELALEAATGERSRPAVEGPEKGGVRASDELADEYRLAAAAAFLAMRDPDDELPSARLNDEILAGARGYFAARSDDGRGSITREPRAADSLASRAASQRASSELSGPLRILPWLVPLAAAAAIVLAVVWRHPPEILPATERLAELRRSADDLLELPWQALGDARFEGVTGGVVWSTRRQEGYLRLRGLPRNDPGAEQYQLWIVDPSRDEHPVDGGVFDATAEELVVPIVAKLAVENPGTFALTLEKPGGVVVSAGPLLLAASR